MARLSKKQKEARAKVDPKKIYTLQEASALVKEITNTKFDASVDLAIRLGVDLEKLLSPFFVLEAISIQQKCIIKNSLTKKV